MWDSGDSRIFFLGDQQEDVFWVRDEFCTLQRSLITNLLIVYMSKRIKDKL